MIDEEEYLYNLKQKDKFLKPFTAYEVSQHFTDCRDVARSVIDELIVEVEFYKKLLKENDPNLIKVFMSFDNRIIRINELQKYLNLTSPIKNKSNINADSIEKAKSIPIESLYDFKGMIKSSSRIKVICPFHAEDSASLIIYKDSNSFHCFGCSSNGDAITFEMKLYNTTFIDAVRRLNNERV